MLNQSDDCPQKLLIDSDPGIDDAAALAFALGSEEVKLLGISTVAGNVPVELTTSNALRLLRAFGREDVPVAAGAARGLVRAKPDHPPIHGRNGLGEVALAAPRRSTERRHAVDFLAGLLAAAEPGSITIAAIGPLTNVALLLALHPDLVDRIARLVVMGGSSGVGNVTPAAEYNTWADPEAAQRVLAAPDLAEICLVELEATRRATVDARTVGELRRGSARGALVAAMIDGYADQARGARPLHDVLALAAVVDPAVIETRSATVDVDTGLGQERGRTRISFADAPPRATGVEVAVGVDLDRFRSLLLDRVAGAAA
jgi:inosine-uridine nucleoside N-ribohydrolase